MDVDDVFAVIGEFGRYQKRTYFLLCLMPFMTAFHYFLSAFIMAVPDHRCALPDWPNDTYYIQNEAHLEVVNRTIPLSTDGISLYASCEIYGQKNETKSCRKWVYDKSIFKTTFASEQNLVCDNALKTSHSSMMFFIGVLLGAFGLGTLSDFIGRKKTIYISVWIMLISTIGLAWSPSFWVFAVLRLVIGVCTSGLYVIPFVLGMELVGTSKRVWPGIVICLFFAVGMVILAGLGYLIRDWMYLELAVSIPNVVFLAFWWVFPESPRWYLAQGKFEEAEKVLKTIAKGNNKPLPEKMLLDLKSDTPNSGRIWELFSNRVLLVRTLVILINWMVVSFGYFGLSLNTGNLSGGFYLNFLLTGLAEFPAYIICLLLLNRIGRRKLHVSCFVLGGVACICTIFTTLYAGEDLQWITVMLANLGKVGISAAYAIMYVWSAELYPTVVRNAGMGLSSASANFGATISPYIANLSKVVDGNLGKAVPLVIFGVSSVVAGLSALLLPETLNHNLPETIEDGKQFGKHKGGLYYKNNSHLIQGLCTDNDVPEICKEK